MKKNVFGRKFKRDRNERKALFKSLLSSLVLYEQIKTTQEKAKAIKGDADRIVTLTKRGKTDSMLQKYLSPKAVEKLIKEIVPRFQKRNGGYTRLIKIGKRFSDDASMVLMEWVEKPLPVVVELGSKNKESKKVEKKSKVKPEPVSKPVSKGTRKTTKKKVTIDKK